MFIWNCWITPRAFGMSPMERNRTQCWAEFWSPHPRHRDCHLLALLGHGGISVPCLGFQEPSVNVCPVKDGEFYCLERHPCKIPFPLSIPVLPAPHSPVSSWCHPGVTALSLLPCPTWWQLCHLLPQLKPPKSHSSKYPLLRVAWEGFLLREKLRAAVWDFQLPPEESLSLFPWTQGSRESFASSCGWNLGALDPCPRGCVRNSSWSFEEQVRVDFFCSHWLKSLEHGFAPLPPSSLHKLLAGSKQCCSLCLCCEM